MTSFNSASFPDSLAIAKESGLTIGSIDEIQKLHIRAVPLGEQARRLAHQEATHTLLVTTSSQPSGVSLCNALSPATVSPPYDLQYASYFLVC